MYACARTHVCMHERLHLYVFLYLYFYLEICVNICIYTSIYTYACIHIYVYIHIHENESVLTPPVPIQHYRVHSRFLLLFVISFFSSEKPGFHYLQSIYLSKQSVHVGTTSVHHSVPSLSRPAWLPALLSPT